MYVQVESIINIFGKIKKLIAYLSGQVRILLMTEQLDPRPDQTLEATPKYAVVAAQLIGAIRDGTYGPGDLLPSEPELTRRFEVSRHTVRAALRSLNEKGLIVSQRGRGSVVQATAIEPRYVQAWDSIEDVLQYAHETPREIVTSTRVMIDDERAESIGCVPGYHWWEIHTRRRSKVDGPYIASSKIWVPDAFGDAVAELENSSEPLFVLLEQLHQCTFAEIRQSICIAETDSLEASDLKLETGTPVMCVERRFYDERGGLLEVSRTVHPGEDFRYETSLRRVVRT